jgi:hypothetical protein
MKLRNPSLYGPFQLEIDMAAAGTDELKTKLVQLTRDFNNKRVSRRDKRAIIPIADAVRSELARRGATMSIEEISLALCDPIGDDAA